MKARRALRSGHAGSRCQALVEFAVVAPILILLITGAAQVGAIFYAQITVDTAAREGARVASEQPNTSQAYSGGHPAGTTTCPSSGSSTNPVCNAVWDAAGRLDGHSFTITIAPAPPYGSPAGTCSATSVGDGYVQVSVSYGAPIFIPVINTLFSSSASRQVTRVVSDRVEPCGLTKGN